MTERCVFKFGAALHSFTSTAALFALAALLGRGAHSRRTIRAPSPGAGAVVERAPSLGRPRAGARDSARRRRFAYARLGAGLLVAAAGCSPDNPLTDEQLAQAVTSDCTALTYQSFGAAFFAQYCLGCHNEQISGDIDRSDAPNGINFNRLDGVRAFRNRIRLRAGVQGDMPPRLLPVPRPSVEERQRLIEWIDCGAPADVDLAAP